MATLNYVDFLINPDAFRYENLTYLLGEYIVKATKLEDHIKRHPKAPRVGERQAKLKDLQNKIERIQFVLAKHVGFGDESKYQRVLEDAQRKALRNQVFRRNLAQNYVNLLIQQREIFLKR